VLRTITVNDEDSGFSAVIKVDQDSRGQRVVELTLRAADGGDLGLENLDLTVLRDLGLARPAPDNGAPAAAAAPDGGGGPVAATAAAVRVPRQRRRGPAAARPYRKAPEAGQLQQMHERLGGPAKVAHELGVPTHTVNGWLRRYRSQGYTFA
jgi:hypothetical protein